MNQAAALLYLESADHNPVVAAWVSIIHAYHLPAASEVSPYDHWEAYQTLFAHGAISGAAFDNTDVKQCFFSGKRPTAGEVQSALDYLYSFVPPQPMESTVSRKDLQVFEGPQTPARKPGNGQGAFPGSSGVDDLAVFDSSREVLPPGESGGLSVFENHSRPAPPIESRPPPRPRVRISGTVARVRAGELGFEGTCFVDGHPPTPVHFTVDEEATMRAEECGQPTGMKEYIFHGQCEVCGTRFCFSAATPRPAEELLP